MGIKVKEFWHKHMETIKNVGVISLSIVAFTFIGVTGLKSVLSKNEFNELVKL